MSLLSKFTVLALTTNAPLVTPLGVTQSDSKRVTSYLWGARVLFASTLILSTFTAVAVDSSAVQLNDVANALYQKQPETRLLQGYETLAQQNQQINKGFFSEGVTAVVKHENGTLTEKDGFQSWEAGVALPLGLGAQNAAREDLASLYQTQSRQYQQLLQWQASGLVRQLSWALKKAQIQEQHQTDSVRVAQQLADKVTLRVNAGESPEIDRVLALKSLAEAQMQLAKAQGELKQRSATYQYWSGYDTLPSALVEALPSPLASLENNPVSIATSHPQLQWLELQLQKAQGLESLAKNSLKHKPSLFIGTKSEQDNQTDVRTHVTAEISIPLGQSAQYKSDMADHAYQVSEQATQVRQTQIQLESALLSLKQQLQASIAMRPMVEAQLTQSVKAYEMARKAYELGASNVQDLLPIQQQMLKAQLESAMYEADYGQQISEYLQTSGDILVTVALP